jgi:ring-1,2-phenylacetyl-CoA epoxidase subunit PaaE
MPTFHPLRVASVEEITDDAMSVTFDVPSELRGEYEFLAGQHLTLRRVLDGVDVRRNYSICAPAGSGRLQVAARRLPGGAFSSQVLAALQPGDTVDVLPPTGRFTAPFRADRARHYAAIAAGSGITPVISLVSTALDVEPESRCTLIYANRTTARVMFLDELADLKDRYPERFTLLHVLSREQQESELLSGRLDVHRLRQLLYALVPPSTVDEWFLCGPIGLIETARAALNEYGVDRRHVHFELFHVEDAPPQPRRGDVPDSGGSAVTSAVTAMLDGRTTTVRVAPDGERILDALLRARPDAPYACRGGVCGTCRAKLVDGEVRMDQNYALEDDERERGFVLACQSHPTTEKVTLDFDA